VIQPGYCLVSESMTAKPPTIYRMRLRSVGSDDDDDIRRLRVMLKTMLRRFRFRVIELEQEREQASEVQTHQKFPMIG
jgi:hypothetical protein